MNSERRVNSSGVYSKTWERQDLRSLRAWL